MTIEWARQQGIRKTFAYHKPSAESLEKIKVLRENFSGVADMILGLCPQSRETSVALTKLEELAMWAIKAVVCNDPSSDVEE